MELCVYQGNGPSAAVMQAFHAELDELLGDLASFVRQVVQMMTDASTALWHADLT
jgi:hypothetical protein